MKKLLHILPLLLLLFVACNEEKKEVQQRDPFDDSNIDFSDYSDDDWDAYYVQWDKNYALIFSIYKDFHLKTYKKSEEVKKIRKLIDDGKTKNERIQNDFRSEELQLLMDYLSTGNDEPETAVFNLLDGAEDSIRTSTYSNWFYYGNAEKKIHLSPRLGNMILESMSDTLVSYYTIQIAQTYNIPGYREKLSDMLEDEYFPKTDQIFSAFAREGDNLTALETAIDKFESKYDWDEEFPVQGYVFEEFYDHGNAAVKNRVLAFSRKMCEDELDSEYYDLQQIRNLLAHSEDKYDAWLIERILPYSNSKGILLQTLIRLEGRSASRTIIQYLNDTEESFYGILEAAIDLGKYGPDAHIVVAIMSNLDRLADDVWLMDKAVWAVLIHGGEADLVNAIQWTEDRDILQNLYKSYHKFSIPPTQLYLEMIELGIWPEDSLWSDKLLEDELNLSSNADPANLCLRRSGKEYWPEVESYTNVIRYDSMAMDMAATSGSDLNNIAFFMEYKEGNDSLAPGYTVYAVSKNKAYQGHPKYYTDYCDIGFLERFMNHIAKGEDLEDRFIRINPAATNSRFIYGPPEGVREFARKYLF